MMQGLPCTVWDHLSMDSDPIHQLGLLLCVLQCTPSASSC